MIKSKIFMRTWSLGLVMCLAFGFTACDTEEKEPEIPDFTEGYKDVKPLPTVTPTAPATVATQAAAVTASAASASVSSDLVSGTITPEVLSAADNLEKAVSVEKAKEISAAFTPEVLSTLASGGSLPASLKEELESLKANPALAAYLPGLSKATVNGQPVGFVGEKWGETSNGSLFDLPALSTLAVTSECTDKVAEAFTNGTKVIEDSKLANEKIVNDAAAALLAAVNATECKTGAANTFTTNAAAAKTAFDAAMAGLSGIEASADITALLDLFVKFDYAAKMDAFVAAKTSSEAACDAAADKAKENINSAKNADLAKIKADYDSAIAPYKTKRDADYKLCHDQGMGN